MSIIMNSVIKDKMFRLISHCAHKTLDRMVACWCQEEFQSRFAFLAEIFQS